MTALLLLTAISVAILLQAAVLIGVGIRQLQGVEASRSIGFDDGALKRPTGGWAGWREFRVESSVFEDAGRTQRSLSLVSVDGQPLSSFAPGQYLTFSFDLPASPSTPKRTIVRCYSLSDEPSAKSYRITVKRMSAPPSRPDLAPGAASSFLHDVVKDGDILSVKAPAGQFFLDTTSDNPAVLIAGGVGVTPMISMIKWSLAHRPSRQIHLFYGVRSGADHAFKVLLEGLAQSHPTFTLDVLYSAPGSDDVEGLDFQHVGFVDVALLKQRLAHGRHLFYICGPPGMMASVVPALSEWGVPQGDVHFESFGPASSGYVRQIGSPAGAPAQKAFDVQFRRSRRTIPWTGEDTNLLDFAERHGVSVEAGCRTGSCGSCETPLVSGEVRYGRKPDFDVSPGACLLCVGAPASTLVLEA